MPIMISENHAKVPENMPLRDIPWAVVSGEDGCTAMKHHSAGPVAHFFFFFK